MLKIFHAIILFILLMTVSVCAQETEPTANSNLTGASLPANALRLREQSVPSEINQALVRLVAAGGGKVRQGESEVLAWTTGAGYKKAQADRLLQELQSNLKAEGWSYQLGETENGVTVFSVLKEAPQRRVAIGFYIPNDDALVIAWTELFPANGTVSGISNAVSKLARAETPSTRNNPSAIVLNVEKDAQYVNVMGKEMPATPNFQALAPKPGKARGYVKDLSGKPLAGASIGVRSTAVGGFYSGGQSVTDANGYYEVQIPAGVAHFYNAGYAIEWGDGLAAVSLHPADGRLDNFSSSEGVVENFVLLPYGITSRENISESPHLPASYYGGALFIGYHTREVGNAIAPESNFLDSAVIEITLTPEGKLFDGSEGKTFVIRKVAGLSVGFRINNIPLGNYKISAKLADGKLLRIRLNTPKNSIFGMSPAETTQSASLLFYPDGAKASMVIPQSGNWDTIQLTVEQP